MVTYKKFFLIYTSQHLFHSLKVLLNIDLARIDNFQKIFAHLDELILNCFASLRLKRNQGGLSLKNGSLLWKASLFSRLDSGGMLLPVSKPKKGKMFVLSPIWQIFDNSDNWIVLSLYSPFKLTRWRSVNCII